MSSTYQHSLAPDGQWHVTGPEVDYVVLDDAHVTGARAHAELIASLLNLAYAVGRHAMVREMVEQKEVKHA